MDANKEFVAPCMKALKDVLNEVGDDRDSFRNFVRKFLVDLATELKEPEKTQWNLKVMVNLVKNHKFTALAIINQLLPLAKAMAEFGKVIDIQQQQLRIQQQAITTRRRRHSQKKLIEDKGTSLQNELEQIPVTKIHSGDEQQVIRTMQKMSGWKLLAESTSSLYQQFLTKTAVLPLPASEQTKVKAAVEAATAALANIFTAAEEEDEKRQLYSIGH